ncbi:MAG: HDOD domain-containing protein [Nitrospirota bacterium]
MDEMEFLTGNICDLPTIPVVASTVLEMVGREETSAADLQGIIEKDQALAGRVLKLSNSALYGCRGSITTLSTAIMIMGFTILKAVVIAASTKNIYKRFGHTEKYLWEHSIINGIASREIAMVVGVAKSEEAFLSGLLHDIGKVVINNNYPVQYKNIIRRVYCEGLDFAEAEKETFGYSHLDVGGLLAKKWKLPEEISTAIRHHHDFSLLSEPFLAKLSAIVNMANWVSLNMGVGGEYQGSMDLDSRQALLFLGLKNDELFEVVDRVKEAYMAEKEVFA